jgi:hypothetical protein
VVIAHNGAKLLTSYHDKKEKPKWKKKGLEFHYLLQGHVP